jgi:drug/metabolite transporter (DMT)-like permease
MNLLEWLRPGGKRPSIAVLAGIGLGFAGVALIALSKDEQGRAVIDPSGAVALLIAPFCWAIGSLYSRQAEQNSSALLNISMQMICGGALMLIVGGMIGEAHRFQLANVTASSAWAFAYLTLIGSLVGFTAYVWLLQVSTPARVSSYAYVNPFVAVVLGKVILKEPFPHSVLLAGALIIVAVVLITSEKRRT